VHMGRLKWLLSRMHYKLYSALCGNPGHS
jgi:hypothetical protein